MKPLFIILCLTLYAMTCLVLMQCIDRPCHRWPDWTKEQRAKIDKVMDRKTTLIRTGLNEAHFYRGGERWKVRL